MPIDFTEEELKRFSPKMKDEYIRVALRRKDVLREHGILENGKRLTHFMAQFGAETNGGTILRESLYYVTVAAIRRAWSARAKPYSDAWITANLLKKPVALGAWAYGGRMGNDPAPSTDGFDFRGGGWIQTTGKDAVKEYCAQCNLELRDDILDDYEATLLFACSEWQKAPDCNTMADADQLLRISRTINVGNPNTSVMPNGWDHRQAWYKRAKPIWWNAPQIDNPAVQLPPEKGAEPDYSAPVERFDVSPPPPLERPHEPVVPTPEPALDANPAAHVAPLPAPEPTTSFPATTADEAPGGWFTQRNFAALNALVEQGSTTAANLKRGKDVAQATFHGSWIAALLSGKGGAILFLALLLGVIAFGVWFVLKRAEKGFIKAAREGRYQTVKEAA